MATVSHEPFRGRDVKDWDIGMRGPWEQGYRGEMGGGMGGGKMRFSEEGYNR